MISYRRSKFSLLVIPALLLGAIFTGSGGDAGLAAQPQAAPIKLKGATFTPARGEAPSLPSGLVSSGYAEGQRGYYIVQFSGPVEQSWKNDVAALGVDLLEYLPEFAFKVRMNPAQARQVENLSSVAWVGLFQPAYKLSPDLARNGTRLYNVELERGADLGLATAAIARAGISVLRQSGNILLVAADGAQVDALARVLDVAWIQNYVPYEKHNETGAGTIMRANVANTNGYDGSTQIVAVADTGLGGGTAATAHPDIPAGRVSNVYNWVGAAGGCFSRITDDGAQDVDSGHGTHVAASVLSDGDANGLGKGTAPAAKLVFQAIENYATVSSFCKAVYGYTDGYYLVGIPDDNRQLFQQAYNAGARIHSNSWGSGVAGDYTLDSANTDDFIWNYRDMAITFSAGNDGIDANSDGVVDNDSTGSPATAKNVITVGASENQRTDNYPCDPGLTGCTGQNAPFTYGAAWGADFPANPIKDDVSTGNAEQMAAFSSRGPTDDGRIKPDVVAPGTWILSGYSDKYQQGYDGATNPQNNTWQYDGWGYPYNSSYKYMGGTSMSNPLVAGGAAVVRDFYQKTQSHSASAALVKATLINSAVDMVDENNNGVNDNAFPIPNNHEGWGRVDLANATDGSHRFVDQTPGLSTNSSATYSYSVAGGTPFKVSLVWSDFPSTEAATKNLVNDLDLTVTSPSGTVYRGNVFSGGWTQSAGSADRTNNVENVYVQSAASGTWTVEVRGYNVPSGPQPFALVVDGASSSGPTPTSTNTPTVGPSNTSTSAPTNTQVPTATNTSLPTNSATPTNTPLPTATSIPTSVPQTPAAPSSLTATAVSRSQINLSWTDNAGNEDGFKIERSTDGVNFTQIATVGANVPTYSNTGLAKNRTYYYRVRAYNSAGNSAYSNTANARTPQR